MYFLIVKNIDYIIDEPEPEEPNKDANTEEKSDYMLKYENRAKDNKMAQVFTLGSVSDPSVHQNRQSLLGSKPPSLSDFKYFKSRMGK